MDDDLRAHVESAGEELTRLDYMKRIQTRDRIDAVGTARAIAEHYTRCATTAMMLLRMTELNRLQGEAIAQGTEMLEAQIRKDFVATFGFDPWDPATDEALVAAHQTFSSKCEGLHKWSKSELTRALQNRGIPIE